MDAACSCVRPWLDDGGESSIIGPRHDTVASDVCYFYDLVHGFFHCHVGGLVGIDLLSEIMMDHAKAHSIKFSDLRAAMPKVPKFEFFSKRKIIGEGFLGWVFDDGPDQVIKASFDRGFRSVMTDPNRPTSPHLPRLVFDYGVIPFGSNMSLHVVSCEKLRNIEPLTDLWQDAYDLNEALDAAWETEPHLASFNERMHGLAKQFDALDDASPHLSIKRCLRDLHAFADRHDLALSPYFTQHQENLMCRDEGTLVFVNPLYDPNITGLPSWMFGGKAMFGSVVPTAHPKRARMDDDMFREETGGDR